MGFDHAVFNVAEWLINNGWMWLCIVALFILANLSLHAVGYAGLLISVLVLVFPQNAAELLGLSAGSVTSTILLGLLAVEQPCLAWYVSQEQVGVKTRAFK